MEGVYVAGFTVRAMDHGGIHKLQTIITYYIYRYTYIIYTVYIQNMRVNIISMFEALISVDPESKSESV